MPRTYKPAPGRRSYNRFSQLSADILQNARDDISDGMSFREASNKYAIPRTTLARAMTRSPSSTKKPKNPGRPTVLNAEEEQFIVNKLLISAEWGYPLDRIELRLIVKSYLDSKGRKEVRFKNDFPNVDWVSGFLKRHSRITARVCQNVKSVRSKVDENTINNFFDQIERTLDGVPAANNVNYDETNLTDDPGKTTVLTRKGAKRADRILDTSKQSTSIMMTVTANGKLLPPYVVYKATHLHDTWCQGGPDGCRYNRTKSGWFDGDTFEDWFEKVPFRYLSKQQGKKVVIGDNLASHLSVKVIEMCEANNIAFVFLPPNSTHLL